MSPPDPQAFIPGYRVRFIELDNACAYLVSHGWAGGIGFDEAVKALGGTNQWQKVLQATDGHNIETISVHLSEGESWTYLRCSCVEGIRGDPMTEAWEFTDHIRRLVYEALRSP